MNAVASPVRSTHPMVVIAAIAVTLFAVTGIGVMLGWIPTSSGTPATADIAPLTAATNIPAPSSAGSETPAAASPAPADKVMKAAPAPAQARPQGSARHPAAVAQHEAAPRTATHEASRPAEPAPRYEPVQVAAAYPPPPPVPAAAVDMPASAPRCQNCGVIETVRQIEHKAEGSGAGAAAGGVLGGLLGHQMGNGRGRDIMTVVGAVGGALAGHQVEKNVRKTVSYEVVVRFEDGTSQVLPKSTLPPWHPGDRVKVVNNEILPNG